MLARMGLVLSRVTWLGGIRILGRCAGTGIQAWLAVPGFLHWGAGSPRYFVSLRIFRVQLVLVVLRCCCSWFHLMFCSFEFLLGEDSKERGVDTPLSQFAVGGIPTYVLKWR